ncbi:MAG: hypothetical protein ACR2NR_13630 [Solirubrobacteraceae bacterium]
MVVSLSLVSKLAFAIVLGLAIFVSACARAPRRSVPAAELRRLVASALILYAVGGLATLTHHPALAALVYATGIAIAALAAWLSRGRDQDDPPDGDEPLHEPPPPEPDGVPRLEWERFEREFRDWERRTRQPTGRT